MKTQLLIAVALLALGAPLANASTDTVTFSLTLGHESAPSIKTCAVSVPAGANGGDVLDAATSAGCISGWTFDTFGGARFVTSIDGIAQQTGVFWAYYVNEEMPCGSLCGIDDPGLIVAGDNVEFVYRDWFTPFPPFNL